MARRLAAGIAGATLGLLLATAAAAPGAEEADAIPKEDLQLLSSAVSHVRLRFARLTDDAVLASGCADALALAAGTPERAARSLEALPTLLRHAHAALGGRASFRQLARTCIDGMVAMLDRQSQVLDAEAMRSLYRGAREAHPEAVRAAWIGSDVLELRLAHLTEQTRNDLQREIGRLVESDVRAPRGILLDLRDNAGGLLLAAVDVSGLFLADGVAVGAAHGRAGRLLQSYRASERPRRSVGQPPALSARVATALRQAPMAVLVNARTASGAEILAAALQGSGRGLLVGAPTAGLGSVQTVYPLAPAGSGMALKLTTAYWHDPKDRELEGAPLAPDLHAADAAAVDVALRRLAERQGAQR